MAVEEYLEETGTVKNDAGGIAAVFIPSGGWNGDNEGNSRPILAIKSGYTRSVVAHPDGAARRY